MSSTQLLLNSHVQKRKSIAHKRTVSFTGQTSPAPFVTPPGGAKRQTKTHPKNAKRSLHCGNTTYNKANAAFFSTPATTTSPKQNTFDNMAEVLHSNLANAQPL